MWCIVEIVGDEDMHIIPGFWLQDDKATTAWPSLKSSFEDVRTSIEDREKPKSDWINIDVAKILQTTGTNESAYFIIINCVLVSASKS